MANVAHRDSAEKCNVQHWAVNNIFFFNHGPDCTPIDTEGLEEYKAMSAAQKKGKKSKGSDASALGSVILR